LMNTAIIPAQSVDRDLRQRQSVLLVRWPNNRVRRVGPAAQTAFDYRSGAEVRSIYLSSFDRGGHSPQLL
jgi:hypothetical protein